MLVASAGHLDGTREEGAHEGLAKFYSFLSTGWLDYVVHAGSISVVGAAQGLRPLAPVLGILRGLFDGRLKINQTLVCFGPLHVQTLAVLDEQCSNLIAWRAIISERLQHSAGNEINQHPLALGGAVGCVILEAIFGIPKVMALLVDIILGYFVVLRRLGEDEHRRQTEVQLSQVARFCIGHLYEADHGNGGDETYSGQR